MIDETGYTHKKGKGAGKYNGMNKSSDWVGKRIKATRAIQNTGGRGVTAGMIGTVDSAHRGLYVTFDLCKHCGSVLHIRCLEYSAIELATE